MTEAEALDRTGLVLCPLCGTRCKPPPAGLSDWVCEYCMREIVLGGPENPVRQRFEALFGPPTEAVVN